MKYNLKIKINEFGPIKNTEISFAPLMIFTGNSSLGKSYINYLIYYFISSITEKRGFFDDLVKNKIRNFKDQAFHITLEEISDILSNHVQDFMRDFLGSPTLTCNVNFHLESNDSIKSNDIKLQIENISDEMRKKLMLPEIDPKKFFFLTIDDKEKQLLFANSKEESIAYNIQQKIQRKLWVQRITKSIILPPARGSFVGENFSFKEKIATSAGMYSLFLKDYDYGLKKPFDIKGIKSFESSAAFFEEQIKLLTGGELISEKGMQYLILGSGEKIPLTAAASSIKELSPLLFYLKNWGNFNLSICIEEPEAHLHPSMQIAVANLLAACINRKMFIQLTTHSDYFLQRINQLLKLGKIRNNDKAAYRKKTEKNESNLYLDEKDICAYYFHADEDKNINITHMPIGHEGIPFSSFFQTIKELSEEDELINEQLEHIK